MEQEHYDGVVVVVLARRRALQQLCLLLPPPTLTSDVSTAIKFRQGARLYIVCRRNLPYAA